MQITGQNITQNHIITTCVKNSSHHILFLRCYALNNNKNGHILLVQHEVPFKWTLGKGVMVLA